MASYCLGCVPAIAKKLGIDASRTPVAKELHERAVALPLHVQMQKSDVDEVVKLVHSWLRARGE